MSGAMNRLYNDLAWLWPMWGATSDYQQYCDWVMHMIQAHCRRETISLLNLGCGGGKNVYNLKRQFEVTGLDVSRSMLDIASELNPECEFIEDDMRSFVLNRQFDAVLIDDAICYMTSENDLRAVFERAYEHLAPGGVMIVGPDDTKESFQQNSTRLSHSVPTGKPEDTNVVFLENNYDPDPVDTSYEALMVYLIRNNGELRIENDLHILGLFFLKTWKEILTDVGFLVSEERYVEDEKEHIEFVCLK